MGKKVSLKGYQLAYRSIRTNEERMAFMAHLVSYFIFSIAFVAANLLTTPDVIWFPFPIVGWGLGVCMHYLFAVKWLDKELEAKEKLAERIALEKLPEERKGKEPVE